MQTGHFASAPDTVRLIVTKVGFKGLFAGYNSFLLRDLPFNTIQFCLYKQLRIGYKLAAKRDLSDLENAVIGAFAGAITRAVTTPLDLIKTRLMTQTIGGSGANMKRLEKTKEKVQHLKTKADKISYDVVDMLLKLVTSVRYYFLSLSRVDESVIVCTLGLR